MLQRNAGHYTHYETDAKNLSPETSRLVVHRIVALKVNGLEHNDQQGDSHGELWKKIAEGCSEGKLKAVNQKCVIHKNDVAISRQIEVTRSQAKPPQSN